MSKQVNKQAGVALITVLIVVALVSSGVALMLKRQNTMIDDITVVNRQANAIQYAISLEEFAKGLLETDYEDEEDRADYYEEDWAKEFAYGIENGQFEAQLFDFQAGVNLNSLFEFSEAAGQIKEKLTPDFFGCFNRLNLKLDSSITGDNIINYLNEKRLRKITHPSELKNITYVEIEDYQKIRPFLFVMDSSVAINVNTAEDEVIACLHPQLEAEAAIESIVSARPYKNINDFYTQLQSVMSLSLAQIKSQFGNGLVDVKSSYFILKGKITIDKLVLNSVSILKRNGSKISVIHRGYNLDI